jgi:hypothetical protein
MFPFKLIVIPAHSLSVSVVLYLQQKNLKLDFVSLLSPIRNLTTVQGQKKFCLANVK